MTNQDPTTLFHQMLRIRMVEEAIAKRYPEGEMRCPVHLSIGQEAVAVGVCQAITNDDRVYSTHRSHAHYLAKGGDLKRMLAEIYGRQDGCIGGRGGSMHLMDVSVGMMASVPIVASSIPVAVGGALADARAGRDRVSVAFIGDASVEEGVFHESVNFAVLRNLPAIFVCENNLYSVYTHIRHRQPDRPIVEVVSGHGIKTHAGDGNDVLAVHWAMSEAVSRVRAGRGPSFLVFDTYRYLEHCGPADDDHLGYRAVGELSSWKSRDPLEHTRSEIIRQGIATDADIDDMTASTKIEIDEAFEFALASPLPEPPASRDHVYAEQADRGRT